MTQEELSKVLKRKAVLNGLCSQWQSEWKPAETADSLIDKFKRGIDFCMEKHFPGADFIDSHFDRHTLHKYHIYVNEEVEIKDVDDDVICVGNCRLIVRMSGFHTGQLYLSGMSFAEIFAADFCRFPVTVYDEASVDYHNNGYNRQFVYRHGGTVESDGDVLVRGR